MTPCLMTNDPNGMDGLSTELSEVKHSQPYNPGAKYGSLNFSLCPAKLKIIFFEYQGSLNTELNSVKLQR